MKRPLAIGTVIVLAGWWAGAAEPDLGTDAQREQGKRLYDKYCSQCHGVAGDGQGVTAPRLHPKPRDFRQGKFKIRTTPSGALPTDDDIKHVIRKGMPYTSMPAWRNLSERELDALVAYIKTFSDEFRRPDAYKEPIRIPDPPKWSEASAKAGRVIYENLGCASCHGEEGRGDGLSAPTLRDEWGHLIRPADLTRPWTFRGGPTRRDIFRAFTTGLNGTPMPSYADSLTEEERWQLVDYIASLSGRTDPDYDVLVRAVKVNQAITLDALEGLFDKAPTAFFPIVGQLQEPGREFYPSCNGIEVRAVYNESDIAFELRWSDMRAETSGRNGPDLEAPVFEFDPYRGAAQAPALQEEGKEEDFWGETNEPSAVPSGPDPTQEFSDAVAVQLPLARPSGPKKPYFIFGDEQHPVDLWFVDLAQGEAVRWVGRGSRNLTYVGPGDVEAIATYRAGQWRVVFKRSRYVMGSVPFDEDTFVPIAFSVWDGFNRERGNKRGLSQWFHVYVEPPHEGSALGPAVRAGLAALVLEFLLVFWIRRRAAGRREDVTPGGASVETRIGS